METRECQHTILRVWLVYVSVWLDAVHLDVVRITYLEHIVLTFVGTMLFANTNEACLQ